MKLTAKQIKNKLSEVMDPELNISIVDLGLVYEIKLIKIWRELNRIDFPSIYLEYLLINNILLNKSKDINSLADNVWHVLNELAKSTGNPLYSRVIDPANSANILSDLLTNVEKNKIISQAQVAIQQKNWNQIVY